MNKHITPQHIQALRDLIGHDQVITDFSEAYNRDEMPIYGEGNGEVLIFPKDKEQVSLVMRYAYAHDIPVTTRGSGTGLVGACVPMYGGIILSTTKMNRIINVDVHNFSAVVQPGVLLMDIHEHLAKHGLYYPPDPGEKSATIGGNVSTNAGGMRAIKYGVTRQYIKALEVVLPNGDIVDLAKNTNKNSTGYDLKDLVIGSEGTLAIITEITLKLIKRPKHFMSLLIPFNSIKEALDLVPEIIKLPQLCTTLEFMEQAVIADTKKYLGKVFPNDDHPAYLIVSYDGDSEGMIHEAFAACADLVMRHGALDVFMSDTEDRQNILWSARGSFLEGIKMSTPRMDECDVVLPIDQIATYLDFVRSLEARYQVRIRSFGHAGDGNLHIYVCQDEIDKDKWEIIVKAVMDQLYQKAYDMGGAISGEHGIGHAKTAYHEQYTDKQVMDIQRKIKAIFDPKNLLNKGKVIA